MNYLDINGIKTCYEVCGNGHPIVLINPFGYDKRIWDRQTRHLSNHFKVITYDYRGVGDSESSDGILSIEDLSDDLHALLEHLNVKRATVIGVGLGGYIAQRLSFRYSEMVERLILISTSLGGPFSEPLHPQTLDMVFKSIDKDEDILEELVMNELGKANRELVDKLVDMKIDTTMDREVFEKLILAAAAFDGADAAKSIKVETLIVYGLLDKLFPNRNAELMHREIVHSKIIGIEDGGYLVPFEKYDVVNKMIIEFIKNN